MSANSLTLDPKSIHILDILKTSDASPLYKIDKDGVHYVLRVYHNNGDKGFNKRGHDLNRFRCELNAYRNLRSLDICREPGRGAVPYYHAYFERLDPVDFDPHLKRFMTDKYHPPAILLDFLPGVEELNCVSYSEGHFEKAVRALQGAHRALVQHYYVYPRIVLIVTGQKKEKGGGKVVWIDFNVAMTYPCREAVSEKGVEYYNYEEEVLRFIELC